MCCKICKHVNLISKLCNLLQKYRSHRKHLLAREAEAASWSHRRQMYGGTKPVGGGVSVPGGKRDMGPWVAPPPSMGFPSMPPVPHYRPLHVWGHPSMERPLMPVWPKHIAHSPSPPPPQSPHVWPPSTSPPPPWHPHHQRVCFFFPKFMSFLSLVFYVFLLFKFF